jgi:lycopene cyclase domain-containing protein
MSIRYWIPVLIIVLTAALQFLILQGEHTLEQEVPQLKSFDFLETNFHYAILLIGSLFFPFILSFDSRVAFYKNWKRLIKATLPVAFVFIIWDMLFTTMAVWGFNSNYHFDFKLLGLPIEELAWFFIIPYCCVFIYSCLNEYLKRDPLIKVERFVSISLGVLFLFFGALFYSSIYTSITFLSAGFITLYGLSYLPAWIRSRFLLAWIVSLLPFLIVNGSLTGMFTESPVVVYSISAITGYRIISIPIEDSVYLYIFLYAIIMLFEGWRGKSAIVLGDSKSS